VVEFGRLPFRATVLGERLDPSRAHAVAEMWRYRIRPAGMWKQYHIDRYKIPRPKKLIEWAAKADYYEERIVRAGRGTALWVLIEPGEPYDDVPQLEEIATLEHAGLQQWAEVITRYGLPRREEDLMVINGQILESDDPLDPPHNPFFHAGIVGEKCQLYRIRLDRLQKIGRDAIRLLDAVRDLLGQQAKETNPGWARISDPDPYWRLKSAQHVTHGLLKSALGDLEPDMDWTEERGIPGSWGLYSFGWWPFVVLEELIHRSRYAPRVLCAARDCSELVPPDRLTGRWVGKRQGAHFCSDRCMEREKKRRARAARTTASRQIGVRLQPAGEGTAQSSS